MPIGSAFPLKNLPIRKEPSAVAGSVPFDEGAEAGTDGGLAEVVTVALHGQTVDADSHSFFPSAVIAVFGIAVKRGHLQDAVGDEVLAGAVALDDGMNQILRHILIIGEELHVKELEDHTNSFMKRLSEDADHVKSSFDHPVIKAYKLD